MGQETGLLAKKEMQYKFIFRVNLFDLKRAQHSVTPVLFCVSSCQSTHVLQEFLELTVINVQKTLT